MISTAQIYLTKRLLFTSFLMLLAVFVPVLMIQLISQLPRSALSSELVWPAMMGLAPTIFYITLPVVVGLANTWAYSEFATEGTLTTLYTAGLSTLNVRLPAFFIAILATMLGYAVSCEISPRGATQIENVVYLIENDLSPSLIEPQRFYTLNGGRRVIQYDERLNKNWIKGVFMRDIDSSGEEEVIFADDAIFERRTDESWIILRNGHIQYRKQGTDGDTVAFTQITRPTGLAGENFPKRKWTGFFEMPLREFFASYEKIKNDPRQLSQWTSEALERFGIPILALAHTMLGLALINLYGGNTGRSSKLTAAIVLCGILFVHFMLVLAAEFASSQGTTLAFIVAGAIVLQMLISIFLFWYAMRRPRRRAAVAAKRAILARG